MGEERAGNLRAEAVLRVAAVALAAAEALVVGLDAQTKTFIFVEKKATPHALKPLWVAAVFAAAAAGYQLLQLLRCLASARLSAADGGGGNKWIWLQWARLLLDQVVAYMMFASTVGAAATSMIAVTGLKQLQWTKLCNIYTRFCVQIAIGILCGLSASVAMAVVSVLSAHCVVKLLPPYRRQRQTGHLP